MRNHNNYMNPIALNDEPMEIDTIMNEEEPMEIETVLNEESVEATVMSKTASVEEEVTDEEVFEESDAALVSRIHSFAVTLRNERTQKSYKSEERKYCEWCRSHNKCQANTPDREVPLTPMLIIGYLEASVAKRTTKKGKLVQMGVIDKAKTALKHLLKERNGPRFTSEEKKSLKDLIDGQKSIRQNLAREIKTLDIVIGDQTEHYYDDVTMAQIMSIGYKSAVNMASQKFVSLADFCVAHFTLMRSDNRRSLRFSDLKVRDLYGVQLRFRESIKVVTFRKRFEKTSKANKVRYCSMIRNRTTIKHSHVI
ncbi:hypothetical protein CANARDRAFT_22684 [[Candida] arabinofermentans NRRL YB-2248]|uniref:NDC10 N-terminal domain-containing protein n=1 Tax=[Candida] arabinofermentans NRRL YB-2248 TaxID=983967 RepID=A0A1E4T2B3_9ASCO|nr:hypothetical protein CANARDRAFT_22684 [[Candida] arabinofermentans NRRL YB-2248]